MPLLSKPIRQAYGVRDPDDYESASNNLWVGNLSTDVTDSVLMALFEKYGAVDSVNTYSSRNYAFIYLKRVEDARAAKEALQGSIFHGNALKIEFAKPAKPCKSLWIGGIGPSVTKEALEEEFLKFGKIEDFKFMRDRNNAYVDYIRLEDASQALKIMNGKRLGGEQIRVDFVRSQPLRREQWPDLRDKRDGQFLSRSMGRPELPYMPQELMRNYTEPTTGSKRQYVQSLGLQKDGQPSNVLWIGYPPSVHIDEQMLHNAMILFGEIERITNFPDRHYSLVEFRSVEEALRAKEGLQGKLFNDPRISIAFSSSDITPKEFSGVHPGVKGPRSDTFFSELPLHTSQVDIYSQGRSVVPNGFPGHLAPRGTRDMLLRPLDTRLEINDLGAVHKLHDNNATAQNGGPNWRKSSPIPGVVSSPSAGIKPGTRSTSSGWDVFDASQLQRESKRSRIDSALPSTDVVFPSKKLDDRGLGFEQLYVPDTQSDGGSLVPLVNAQRKNRLSPIGARAATGGIGLGQQDHNYMWRGIIAKGGTPVCRARCVSIGEGIGSEIPEVVNCSARTGLDMLTKHYADAIGFDIVFFLPDSEDDFASYTEFLRYLGAKGRAGVAKFDDGTTLFLVPPSEFLTKVLKVVGPERLYGVVLKFQQHAPSSTYTLPDSRQPQYLDRRQISSSQTDYGGMPKEARTFPMDYNDVLQDNLKPPSQPLHPLASTSFSGHSAPLVSTGAVSQAGVSLTPELITALASLLPAGGKLSGLESAQPPPSSNIMGPSSALALDKGLAQGWNNEYQVPEHGPLVQQSGQLNSLAQHLPQLQAYPTASNSSIPSIQGVTGPIQAQDPSVRLPPEGAYMSRPASNFAMASQGGQFVVAPQVNQHYQLKNSEETQNNYGMGHGSAGFGSYSSAGLQQPTNPMSMPSQVHGVNVSQSHATMPSTSASLNMEIPNQSQQFQPAAYGADQGTSEAEVDKNERYQSTLRFAANLLFQIQQQQHPPSTQAGQGSGSH